MITKEDIDRINFLYKKSKSEELEEEEKSEQQKLRKKYIDWIRFQVKSQLGTVEIQNNDSNQSN
ncbi:MAG: DUF896 domain-containing protein [Firmicutes bacterium]|nr:DUF896 domain-containing protein [Bacillota bacterium]